MRYLQEVKNNKKLQDPKKWLWSFTRGSQRCSQPIGLYAQAYINFWFDLYHF